MMMMIIIIIIIIIIMKFTSKLIAAGSVTLFGSPEWNGLASDNWM